MNCAVAGHHLGVLAGLGADVHRVAHVGARERDDRGRHGGREQHRLPGLGGLLEQPLHVGQEAEVEHLVGLVEDERLHVGDVERAAVHQVDEAARRTDHDVDAGGEGVELRLVGHAAVDGEHADAAVLAGHRQVLADLERELAGRGHDQRLRLAGRDQLVVVGVVRGDAALDHGDPEGEGLAGAGAGLADQVGAHQGDREGHLLDGERVDDVDALEGVRNLGKDPELSEGCQDAACSVLTRRVLVGGFSGWKQSVRAPPASRPQWYFLRVVPGASSPRPLVSLSVGCRHDRTRAGFRRLRGPRLPCGRRRPAGRDHLRGDLGLPASHRRREARHGARRTSWRWARWRSSSSATSSR